MNLPSVGFSLTNTNRLEVLEDIFASHGDAIAVIDAYGTFLLGNRRYAEMFFEPGKQPKTGESAIEVVRRIVEGGQVVGLDQMDPDQAVLNCLIDCYSFVQGAEFALTDGRVIQVSSSPTKAGGHLMTFRDTGRDRIGERRAVELLSNGFNSADMGMVLWDAGLAVQLVNPAWRDLTLPVQVGDDVRDVFQGFVESEMLAVPQGVSCHDYVKATIAQVHRSPMQFTLHGTDGRRVQLSTFAIASGGVMATAIDITERSNTEDRARALLHDAVEALEIGIVHFDVDLKLLMRNETARQMIMLDRAPFPIGAPLSHLICELIDRGEMILPDGVTRDALVQDIVKKVRGFQKGLRPLWKNGRVLEMSINPTQMGGYLVSTQDLTEAVNADRAASEANELVKTIVDASPTTFLVSKVESGEIVFATSASKERFGDISSTRSFFLKPEDRTTYLEALLPTGSLTDYPVKFRKHDGTIMDGLTSARVIEYRGEQMIVAATRDITDHLAMQKELEIQRNASLQNEKLAALGELLAGVAHELSNPLSVIVGYAMMLRDQNIGDPYMTKVERIAVAADRCTRIVKMFLALAREKPALSETCDIAELVTTAIAVSDGGLAASGAKLRIEIPHDLPLVTADPDHITQVFSNLIVNAGHAISDLGPAGMLAVRAHAAEDCSSVTIEVEDNGPGVPPAIQHRIFEPFFTTRDVGQGTGVGLTFSHRVISAHGGTLSVANNPDGGAIFRVTLPTRPQTPKVQGDGVSQIDRGSTAQNILVLDDDQSVSQVLKDILQGHGYLVDVFDTGKTALRGCAVKNYQVILSDMRMPDMNGEGFFRVLHQLHPELADRVIFLTGDTLNAAAATFMAQSGRPCLEKPLSPEDLLFHVNKLAAQVAQ